MLEGLVVGRCLERKEPGWGPDGAFAVVPGRRRGFVGLVPLPLSFDDCDDLPSLGKADDGR
jgi:hypothetical protein